MRRLVASASAILAVLALPGPARADYTVSRPYIAGPGLALDPGGCGPDAQPAVPGLGSVCLTMQGPASEVRVVILDDNFRSGVGAYYEFRRANGGVIAWDAFCDGFSAAVPAGAAVLWVFLDELPCDYLSTAGEVRAHFTQPAS
jgi:hypothetical protein